eukprot:5540591-Prymnesium_polylepis.1
MSFSRERTSASSVTASSCGVTWFTHSERTRVTMKQPCGSVPANAGGSRCAARARVCSALNSPHLLRPTDAHDSQPQRHQPARDVVDGDVTLGNREQRPDAHARPAAKDLHGRGGLARARWALAREGRGHASINVGMNRMQGGR